MNARERGFNTIGRAEDVAVDHMRVMSGHALQEFRFQFARHVVDSQTFSALNTPSINRPSGNFGKPVDRPFGRTANHYQFVEHFSYSRGAHDVKVGADITVIRVAAYRYFNLAGTFIFGTDLPFDANDPTTYPTRFTQNIGSPFTQRDDEIYAVFFQDHWRLRRNLTVNVGARYDRETATKAPLALTTTRTTSCRGSDLSGIRSATAEQPYGPATDGTATRRCSTSRATSSRRSSSPA